jgi:hypothetical protein
LIYGNNGACLSIQMFGAAEISSSEDEDFDEVASPDVEQKKRRRRASATRHKKVNVKGKQADRDAAALSPASLPSSPGDHGGVMLECCMSKSDESGGDNGSVVCNTLEREEETQQPPPEKEDNMHSHSVEE